MQKIDLFSPSRAPVAGMRSAVTPSALAAGEWAELTNVRFDDRTIRVRDGASQYIVGPTDVNLGSPSGGAELRGVWMEQIGGDLVVYQAIYVDPGSSPYVAIWRKWGAAAWAELTAASGKFGNTRITSGLDDRVAFAKVAPPEGGEYLVIQNGALNVCPRVSKLVSSNTDAAVVPHKRISFPLEGQVVASPQWSDQYDIGAETAGSASTDGGLTIQSLSSLSIEAMSIGTTTPSDGDQVNWAAAITAADMTNGPDPANTKQLHFIYNCTQADPWANLEIEAKFGTGAFTTIWKPGSTATSMTVVGLGDDYYLAAIDIEHHKFSGDLKDLRFTYRNSSRALTVLIYNLGTSGLVPSASQFYATYYSAGGLNESPSVSARTQGQSFTVRGQGTRTAPVITYDDATGTKVVTYVSHLPDNKALYLPDVPGLYYSYSVQVPNPSTAADFDATHIRVYMQPFATDEQYEVANLEAASYSAGWSFTASTAAGQLRDVAVNTTTWKRREAPDGLHLPCPTASVMLTTNNRLICGQVREECSSADARDVWVSEDDEPFRFRKYVRTDSGAIVPEGASRCVLQGETVQALATVSGSILGADPILVLTDQNVYSLDGSDALQLARARRLSPHGTLSPQSVTTYQNQVYWLDRERNVRSLDWLQASPSMLSVEDILRAIPDARIGDVSAAAWRDRLYIAYTPAGGSQNTEILVYDLRTGSWSRDSFAEINVYDTEPVTVSGARVLLLQSSNRTIYQHESAGQSDDAGAAIPVTLLSRELTGSNWNAISIRRVGVVADKQAASLTVTRVTRESTATPVSGTIDLTSSTGRNTAWRYDKTGSGARPIQVTDFGVRVRITGNLAGGKRFYEIGCEYDVRPSDGR